MTITRVKNTTISGVGDKSNNLKYDIISATGGTTGVTGPINGATYQTHQFDSSGNFVINSGYGLVDYIVIAGGASGGLCEGVGASGPVGGGGAGAVLRGSAVLGPGTYDIVIGAGGASQSDGLAGAPGFSGNDSTFAIFIRARGGGYGGARSGAGNNATSDGGQGGSGGGGGTNAGGFADNGGNAGGASGSSRGGGGGGAGAVGVGGSSGGTGGAGTDISDFFGQAATTTYVGGGGGGALAGGVVSGHGAGGIGGGGAAARNTATAGTDGTGGGGGAACTQDGAGGVTGKGGNGRVYLRYRIT
jgi:hypothetical protein